MNKYEVLSTIGEGAYGVVMQGRHRETGELVAIKRFKESEEDEAVRKTSLREVKLLRMMKDETFIVKLIEAFRRKGRLYLVFPYVGKNLLEELESQPQGLDGESVRRMIFTLLAALYACHSKGVIHRDIKPENLLVHTDGTLRLCDFGFARSYAEGANNLTDYVATRWYRSPELLLGTSNYGLPSDLWAVGCIMSELIDGQALFPGETEVDQLFLIQNMLGAFTQDQILFFKNNPRFAGFQLNAAARPDNSIDRRFVGKKVSKRALSFLKSLIQINPANRPTVEEAMRHPYFEGLCDSICPSLKNVLHPDVLSTPQQGLPSANRPASPPQSTVGGGGGSRPSTAGQASLQHQQQHSGGVPALPQPAFYAQATNSVHHQQQQQPPPPPPQQLHYSSGVPLQQPQQRHAYGMQQQQQQQAPQPPTTVTSTSYQGGQTGGMSTMMPSGPTHTPSEQRSQPQQQSVAASLLPKRIGSGSHRIRHGTPNSSTQPRTRSQSNGREGKEGKEESIHSTDHAHNNHYSSSNTSSNDHHQHQSSQFRSTAQSSNPYSSGGGSGGGSQHGHGYGGNAPPSIPPMSSSSSSSSVPHHHGNNVNVNVSSSSHQFAYQPTPHVIGGRNTTVREPSGGGSRGNLPRLGGGSGGSGFNLSSYQYGGSSGGGGGSSSHHRGGGGGLSSTDSGSTPMYYAQPTKPPSRGRTYFH